MQTRRQKQVEDKPPASGQSTGANQAENREDKFSIQTPQISLPKGGGAIKGIDEKFEVNVANGTASFSLPLPFSPARNGFMPAIALSYNSGAGNGIFGIGWDLGYPSIQRKTDKKLPRYRDDEDSDTFMFSGVEDLVPFLDVRGQADEFTSGAYRIRRFRPRIEGAFSRIERITHRDHGVWWKVTTRENVVTFFGKSPEYRIASGSRIFQWLPELSYDDKGNCVLYEFKTEDGAADVWVSVRTENGSLTLEVRDNGRGFEVAQVKRGNGLWNMQRRAERMGGEFGLESRAGEGTRVKVKM